MDSSDQPLEAKQKVTEQQLLAEARQEVASRTQVDKPKKLMTDADAQAILMTHDLLVGPKPKAKAPYGLIITIVVLILLAIAASFAVGGLKPASSNASGSNSQSSSQSNSPTGNTDNQINQDVRSCSDPATAISEC